MCYQEGKASNYYENVSILGRNILQATNYSREEFVKIKNEVIKRMISFIFINKPFARVVPCKGLEIAVSLKINLPLAVFGQLA